MESFQNWLNDQLKQRKWKPAELARESGLSSAVISNLLNGHRNLGEKTGNAIAHALKLPPDLVFEKAGMLPAKTELSPLKRTLVNLIKDLPDSDLEMVIALLEQRSEYYKKNPQAKPAK